MINYLMPSEIVMTGLVLHSKKLHCSFHFYFVAQINLCFKKFPFVYFLKLKLQKHIFCILLHDSLLDLNSEFN